MELTYEIEIEEEDMDIERAFPELEDKELVDQLIRRLNRGDLWAYCWVKVSAVLVVGGRTYRGFAGLGCCSYENEEDFKKGGYYEQLKDDAFLDLQQNLRILVDRGDAARAVLAEWATVTEQASKSDEVRAV